MSSYSLKKNVQKFAKIKISVLHLYQQEIKEKIMTLS